MTISKIFRPIMIKTNKMLLKSLLRENPEVLSMIHMGFLEIADNHKILIRSFIEGRPVSGLDRKVRDLVLS